MAALKEKIAELNEVDRFILLLLGAKKAEPVPSPIHFQKEIFLLSELFPELGEETDYEPYFLGPHSEIVADEANQLASSGLIKPPPGRIELTREGKEVYDFLSKQSPKEAIEKIEEFKEFLNDLSKDELLAFIYFSYPSVEELEKESIEYKDLLPKRKRLAISLYHKGKISAEKAAQIAGEDLEEFIHELKNV